MSETTHFTIRINNALKMKAIKKANEEFGMGLGTLTKIFLKHFVGEIDKSKIVFYVGDETFDTKLEEVLMSKKVKTALKRIGNAV